MLPYCPQLRYFGFSFSNFYSFATLLLWYLALAKTSSVILIGLERENHLALWITFNFSLLSWCWLCPRSKLSFFCFGISLESPISPGYLSKKNVHLMRSPFGFCCCLGFLVCLVFQFDFIEDCISFPTLNSPACMEWSLLNNSYVLFHSFLASGTSI